MTNNTPTRIRFSIHSKKISDTLMAMSSKKRSIYVECALHYFGKDPFGQAMLNTMHSTAKKADCTNENEPMENIPDRCKKSVTKDNDYQISSLEHLIEYLNKLVKNSE